jgi:hypothetical protein
MTFQLCTDRDISTLLQQPQSGHSEYRPSTAGDVLKRDNPHRGRQLLALADR